MTEPRDILLELRRLAEHGAIEAFREKAKDLHPSDLSDVLADLDDDARLNLVRALPPGMVSEALAEMEPEEHPEELLAALDPGRAADIVEELEDDDAADLIGDLPPDKATTILAEIDDRAGIERR